MHSPAHEFSATVPAERDAPCLSHHQPTLRHRCESMQDSVDFRVLAKQLASLWREPSSNGGIQTPLRFLEALLTEANRVLPGRIEGGNGEISSAAPTRLPIDHVLDDLGGGVLKQGDGIVVVPTDRLPTKIDSAGTGRFQ